MTQNEAGISLESVIECFPLSFVLDGEGRLTKLGRYFAAHHPEISGKQYGEVFTLAGGAQAFCRVLGDCPPDRPSAAFPRECVELRLRTADDMLIAGSLLPLARAQGALFIGTISPRDITKVTDYGLTMSDFAPFDASAEFAMMAQINEAVLKDTRILNEHLAAARDEAVLARKEVEATALVDTLSGLANRAAFQRTLAEGASDDGEAPELDELCSLLVVDIDNFKPVNDRYGHAVGDELIKSIGRRVLGVIDDGAEAYRIGGDEFAVIFRGMSAYRARRCADNIMRAVHEPHYVNERRVRVSASGGLATRMFGVKDLDSLYKAADIALYEAKRSNSNKLQTFTTGMGQRELEKKLLERDLVEAVESGTLAVFVQPQFDIRSGAMSGAEGLVRWWNGRLERDVPPSEFIPLAEDCGLISQIDMFVFETVLRQQRAMGEAGRAITWSSNLSPITLGQEDLPQRMRAIINRVGKPRTPVSIEITEGAIVSDTEAVGTTLRAIRGMGMEVAIDDFGAGQTSLSHLTRLPISRLKLDRSLVERIDKDGRAETIAHAIVALALELGLAVTAEGIERMSQAEKLQRMGPMQAQGFLFARPMPLAQFAALVSEGAAAAGGNSAAAG